MGGNASLLVYNQEPSFWIPYIWVMSLIRIVNLAPRTANSSFMQSNLIKRLDKSWYLWG